MIPAPRAPAGATTQPCFHFQFFRRPGVAPSGATSARRQAGHSPPSESEQRKSKVGVWGCQCLRGRVLGSGNVCPAPLGPTTGLSWHLGRREVEETDGQRVGLGG